MKIKDHEIDFRYAGKVVLSIALGTGFGLIVYAIFLYFKIAIVGWNLGLIFAPLGAGYVETVVANRLLGKDLGAISAFILFIDTTIYSFILKNPTLGMNLITAGSIIVILQAAFPTLINYILLVIIIVLMRMRLLLLLLMLCLLDHLFQYLVVVGDLNMALLLFMVIL